jgi:ABC-type transport system involved in multi-copper enzyme maturation permease subunit
MSPIHDQTYRHYEGARTPPGRGWSVIMSEGIRAMMNRRFFLIVLIAAWVPFIVRTVMIYVSSTSTALARYAPVDAAMFEAFLRYQGIFVFFVTVYVGAGLIANDRRANALQIYLAKPLHRTEYIAGKFLVLAAYLALVTLVPALLLVLVQILLSGSIAFIRANSFVVPAIIVASVLRIVVCAITMLALSSLSKSSRFAGVMYTGAIFFTDAVFGVLGAITGSTRVAWASITANLDQVTDLIFRQPLTYETPAVVSLLVLAGLIVLSVSVLERRVRGVEIVQ